MKKYQEYFLMTLILLIGLGLLVAFGVLMIKDDVKRINFINANKRFCENKSSEYITLNTDEYITSASGIRYLPVNCYNTVSNNKIQFLIEVTK